MNRDKNRFVHETTNNNRKIGECRFDYESQYFESEKQLRFQFELEVHTLLWGGRAKTQKLRVGRGIGGCYKLAVLYLKTRDTP